MPRHAFWRRKLCPDRRCVGLKPVSAISERDGFRCFWAQPLDPVIKHPAGTPFAVQHFHRTRFSIRYQDTGTVGLGIARDKIVFAMSLSGWWINTTAPSSKNHLLAL